MMYPCQITCGMTLAENGRLEDSIKLCSQPTSKFAEAYSAGIHKSKYWEPIYEDSLNLIAKLPAIAAHIYRCGCSLYGPQLCRKFWPA